MGELDSAVAIVKDPRNRHLNACRHRSLPMRKKEEHYNAEHDCDDYDG